MYKSKKLLAALLFIMVTCLSLAFAACAPKTVTVTLYDGQEVVLQEEVKVGDSFVLPDRSKDGFEFLGWGETENSSSPSKGAIKPQYDVTLYAIWQKKEQKFTVTFVDYDGTTIVQREVVKGQAATPPENPTRKGYTFVGWDTDFSNVQGRLRVTAQYEVNSYKVTFMSLGQKVEGDDVVSKADFGTAITPPQLNVAGLVFKGWYTDENYAEGSLVDFGTFVMPDSEVVFYAKWAAKEDIGLSIQNSATNVVYGDTFVLTALHDEKDGITYTYRWFKDGVEINGENEKTLQVVAQDVVKHTYSVEVSINKEGATSSVANSSVDLTAQQRTLDVTVSNASIVYGDEIPTFVFSLGNAASFDDIDELKQLIQIICDYEKGDDAGNYQIDARPFELTNYTLDVTKGNLTVKQKEITLTIEGNKTFDNKVWSGAIVADGVISMDTFAGTASTKKVFGELPFTSADDFDVNYSITRNGANQRGNYAVSFEYNVVINAIDLNVEISEAFDGVYDGQNHLPEVTVGKTLTKNEVKILFNGETIDKIVNQGTYNLCVSVTALGYNDFSREVTVKIAKREVIVSADEKMTYSYRQVWSKSDWADGVTNLVGGHSFEGTLATTNFQNGVYTANGSELGDSFEWLTDRTIMSGGVDVSKNYTVSYDIKVQIIKNMSVEANDTTVTFDGNAHTPDVTVADPADGADLQFSTDGDVYSSEVPSFTNAGTYTVYYKATAANYYEASGSVTITINKKDLTLTADNKAVSYGDAIPEFTYTQSGLVDSDSEKLAAGVSFNCAYKAGSFVGAYDVEIKYTDGNYNITLNKGKLTVSQKELVLNVEDRKSFDNTAFVKQYSVTDGVFGGDTVSATVTTNGKSGTFGKDDVSFEFTAMRGGQNVKENYTLTLGEVNIEIQNISMEVTVDGFDGVYDGQNHLPKVNGETLTEKTVVYKVGGEVVTEIKNAGVYQVEVTVSAEGYDDCVSSVNVQIAQKQVSVSIDRKKDFKENEPWSNSVWDSYATGLIAGDQLQGTLKTNGYQNKVYEASGSSLGSDFVWEGGSYKIMSGETDVTANYTLTYDLRINIGKYIEVSGNDSITVSYNGKPYSAAITVVSPENATITYKVGDGEETSVAPSFTEVGTYTVSYTVTAEGYFDESGEFTITIEKATLNITIDGVVKTYGQNFNISEVVPHVEGLADGDQLDFAITSDWKQQVGSYTITLAGGETEHYVWFAVTAKITVNKAALTIDVTSGEITYGDVLSQLDFKVSGAVNGDDEKINSAVNPSCDYVQGMNVGSYDINAVYTDGNYEVTVNKGTLTVKQKEITLTIEGNKTFDNKVWSGAIVADGVISMDTFAGTASTKKEFDKNAFTAEDDFDINFTITRDGADKHENYAVTFVCNVKINEAELSVTVGEGFNGIYDGQNHLPEVKVDETLTHNTVTILVNGMPSSQVTDAGTYNITISVTAFGYKTFNDIASVRITKREIVLHVDETKDYKFGVVWEKSQWGEEATNIVEGHTFEGTLATTNFQNGVYTANGSELGDSFEWLTDRTIMSGGVDVSKNYTVSYDIKVQIIKNMSVEANDTTVTFDGNAHTPDVTVADPADGADLQFSTDGDVYSSEVPSFTNAGTYTVYYKATAANYYEARGSVTITIGKKDLTITADDKTVTYGDAKPELTYNAEGFVENETQKNIVLSCDYEQGSNVGSYPIAVSYANDNYNVSLVSGTLTVNKKVVVLDVVGTKAFDNTAWSNTYSIPAEQLFAGDSLTVTVRTNDTIGSYTNGANLVVTVDGKRGETDVTANYDVQLGTVNVVIENIDMNLTVDNVTAQYDGQSHAPVVVGDTLTEKTVTFKVGGVVQTSFVNAGEYTVEVTVSAKGYNDFVKTVSVSISKVKVVIKGDEIRKDVTEVTSAEQAKTIVPQIVRADDGTPVSGLNLTFDNSVIVPNVGDTYVITATLDDQNYTCDNPSIDVTVKITSVQWNGNNYTIEEALNLADSGQIVVKANTNFTTAVGVYVGTGYYTLKQNVTLLLPYKDGDTIGNNKEYVEGSSPTSANPKLYFTLTIGEGITFNNNGTLVVGAETGLALAGIYEQGGLTGNYSRILLEGTINSAGTVEVYGSIEGTGTVHATSGTIRERMDIIDWRGGTCAGGVFLREGRKIGISNLGSTITEDKPNIFPFKQYDIKAVSAKLVLESGTELKAIAKIFTDKAAVFNARYTIADMYIISNSGGEGFFKLAEGATATLTHNDGREKIEISGGAIGGVAELSMSVSIASVKMDTGKILFPIDGDTDIVLANGNYSSNYGYKLMPGATFTVGSGATFDANGEIVIYKESDITYPSATGVAAELYPKGRGDAQFIVAGSLNINGTFGGHVSGISGAKVTVNTANLTGESKEGYGTKEGSFSFTFHFHATSNISNRAQLKYGDILTDMVNGTTYTMTDEGWI